MDKKTIIDEIKNKVTTYSSWQIGITDDLQRRKGEHDNPEHWRSWIADSEDDARSIEKYFLDKGMKGDIGGGISPNKVYIF